MTRFCSVKQILCFIVKLLQCLKISMFFPHCLVYLTDSYVAVAGITVFSRDCFEANSKTSFHLIL